MRSSRSVEIVAHVNNRSRCTTRPRIRRPRAHTASICVGALECPDGGGYISHPRSLHDLPTVHEPDRNIAAGVLPENVTLAVAVEIAGLDDRPHERRGRADTRRLGDLRTV